MNPLILETHEKICPYISWTSPIPIGSIDGTLPSSQAIRSPKILFDNPEKFSSVPIPWGLFESAQGKILFFASGLPDYQTDD
jgi:hypothetical protein